MKTGHLGQSVGNYFRPVTIIGLSLLLVVFASTTRGAEAEDKTPNTEFDPKSKAELLQMEERFGAAVEKRDTAALNEILADYFAGSYLGAKRAFNKRGAIAKANEGLLTFFRIEKEQKTNHSVDIFTVEGLAKEKQAEDSGKEQEEKWVHVRRLWTKKDDRWMLVAQILGPREKQKEAEKK